jgi:hypothetical protein
VLGICGAQEGREHARIGAADAHPWCSGADIEELYRVNAHLIQIGQRLLAGEVTQMRVMIVVHGRASITAGHVVRAVRARRSVVAAVVPVLE